MTADHAYVLTPTDVRNIRNYVLSKYAAMNSAKRAEIVADAVSRIIHRQLPDFDYATKHRLTSQLIRTTVLEEKRPVSADDIYALCMELDLNDERVLKEIALFADRCDISEEITRFRSHAEQFATLIESRGEIGRKAEFILQEMGREVHTMGSKANDLTIARHVIELKNELERVREQMANVE